MCGCNVSDLPSTRVPHHVTLIDFIFLVDDNRVALTFSLKYPCEPWIILQHLCVYQEPK